MTRYDLIIIWPNSLRQLSRGSYSGNGIARARILVQFAIYRTQQTQNICTKFIQCRLNVVVFPHLKLCIADAIHNFKWMKTTLVQHCTNVIQMFCARLASVWSSRPIWSLRYIVTCTRLRSRSYICLLQSQQSNNNKTHHYIIFFVRPRHSRPGMES